MGNKQFLFLLVNDPWADIVMMTTDTLRRFPLLRIAGSPYAMGRMHGETAKTLITRSLAICREMLPVPFEQAMAYCAPSLAHAREAAPELMEEVRGIADGLGFTPAEIFTLNASLDFGFPPASGERHAAGLLGRGGERRSDCRRPYLRHLDGRRQREVV